MLHETLVRQIDLPAGMHASVGVVPEPVGIRRLLLVQGASSKGGWDIPQYRFVQPAAGVGGL